MTAIPGPWRAGRILARRFRLFERVVDLHEVNRCCPQDCRQLGMGAGRVVVDAKVADEALGLPRAQGVDVRAPVEQVVDLHQVQLPCSERVLEGAPHFVDPRLTSAGPDLGGDKRAATSVQGREARSHYGLGAANTWANLFDPSSRRPRRTCRGPS